MNCKHGVNGQHCKACKTAHAKKLFKQAALTPKQMQNWRNTLTGMYGAIAVSFFTEQDIQRFRDLMQEEADKLETGDYHG